MAMADRQYYGKQDEKEEEKELGTAEKEEEKATGAWGYEKWQRDPLSSIVWAGMLIWAGVALLLANLGILSWRIGDNRIEPWSIVFIGASLILLIEVLIRLVMPAYRRAVGGTLFFAVLLLAFGLEDVVGWDVVWPLILIALGVFVLLRGVFRGGRSGGAE
jgi:hypothetical protein